MRTIINISFALVITFYSIINVQSQCREDLNSDSIVDVDDLLIIISSFNLRCTTYQVQEKLKDIDGNVYDTIKIGTQVWFKQNLIVKRYTDGTPIPFVTDNNIWANCSQQAYCWYNNDSVANVYKKGALYNWYAVNNKKICPTGWKVPDDNDWNILEKYLSTIDTFPIENYLLNQILEINKNTRDINMLFPGYRNYKGNFTGIDNVGVFWTTTQDNSKNAWTRVIHLSNHTIERSSLCKKNGHSVRCIKE